MRIKARMGTSIDGYVATTDGMPILIKAADFVPGRSHGYPEFIAGCDAVAMGRQTFLPALGAPQWPWRDMTVHVLTSRPLPFPQGHPRASSPPRPARPGSSGGCGPEDPPANLDFAFARCVGRIGCGRDPILLSSRTKVLTSG